MIIISIEKKEEETDTMGAMDVEMETVNKTTEIFRPDMEDFTDDRNELCLKLIKYFVFFLFS